MFRSKSSKSSEPTKLDSSNSNSAEFETINSNGNTATASQSQSSVDSIEANSNPPEVGKEAKEKKESWVKTIGIRTLRIRRSTDSRSSRLSLPGFSSLDRSSKKEKSKEDKKKSKDNKTHEEATAKSKSRELDFSSGFASASAATTTSGSTSTSTSTPAVHETHVKVGDGSCGAPSLDESTLVLQVKDIAGENSDKHDPGRFLGDGLTFKGKLIGVLEVSGPRGDRICQEALSDLKMAVKAAGEHKQKVTIHVALDGLRIRDEKTLDCLYHHQVHKISFIAQDLTDSRAFGYIFGSPDTGHRFFGIKTEKSASQVVIAMRDLFQVVFDFKKKEIEKAKQQLEMQKKYLATRAAEPTLSASKPEKFSIAETYIEGACASSVPPNRTAPEVDLLNLEVELTSLQEGLDSIHHNLVDSSIPFKGSTASIASESVVPPFQRSSVSSTGANSTPIPGGFPSTSDPFGDSFDPFTLEHSAHHHHQQQQQQHAVNFKLGPEPSKIGSNNLTFSSDPFAQEDPFISHRLPGDSDFFNSDPFDSPSGPFSFSFPPLPGERVTDRVSPAPAPVVNGSATTTISSDRKGQDYKAKVMEGWTASFEDNFVPEPIKTFEKFKPNLDIFMDLDPLGPGRKTSFSTDHGPPSGFSISSRSSCGTKHSSEDAKEQQQKMDGASATAISSSFSTNFTPEFNHFDRLPRKSESPPNYSPPAPPRGGVTGVGSSSPRTDLRSLKNNHTNTLILPPNGSPRTARKKSDSILKQITISNANASPKTLPKLSGRYSVGGGGKQFNDSSFGEDIPNLSPPPRPPHSNANCSPANAASPRFKASATAVPRPSSASEKSKKIPGNVSISGLPPEPPPRPFPSSNHSSHSHHDPLPLVSPPPLPPKKNNLSNTLSSPIGMKREGKKPLSHTFSRSAASTNDLPLPIPSRRNHGEGGRYAVPQGDGSSSSNNNKHLDKLISESSSVASISYESALIQVAQMSLKDLAVKLSLPVDRLSSFTIQQLAQKLAEINFVSDHSSLNRSAEKASYFGFDDDFSTASAPALAKVSSTSTSASTKGFDRYAVFRELAVEDASGFSVANNAGSGSERIVSDEDEGSRTLEKAEAAAAASTTNFTSRGSSSERTLQADDVDLDLTEMKSASYATALANTMDDVTDVNLSDDPEAEADGGKYALDDEEELGVEFVKGDWATFESNLEDKFATTALVKADGNENDSPWDSDEGGKSYSASPRYQDALDQFDFKPFEKPAELLLPLPPPPQSVVESRRKNSAEGKVASPDRIRSPPTTASVFQRQSSGSSRQSERSGVGGGGLKEQHQQEYGEGWSRRQQRLGSKDRDRDRWEFDRDGSGRSYRKDRDYRERDRERPDSRSSYSSIPRKYRNEDSEEEYSAASACIRRPKGVGKGSSGGGGGSGSIRRNSREYERDRPIEMLEDEDDDRSYASASHHSNYSSSYRRYRRYPSGKHGQGHHGGGYGYSHSHHSRGRRDQEISPDQYSNQESDDGSLDDGSGYGGGGGYAKKRDRESYTRERDYYERHHRPKGNSAGGKRYSPRHSDPYYRRGERVRGGGGRYRDHADDHGDSREDYSGDGDEGSRSGHYGHRRMRAKRSHRDEPPGPSRGHYYTNSPSWDDSDSGAEEVEEGGDIVGSKARRSDSAKDRGREKYIVSPDCYTPRRGVHKESRKYRSDLALNSKDSPKLALYNFEDDFGATSLPMEKVGGGGGRDDVGSAKGLQKMKSSVEDSSGIEEKTNGGRRSPFQDGYAVDHKKLTNGGWDTKTAAAAEAGAAQPIIQDLLDCREEAAEQEKQKLEDFKAGDAGHQEENSAAEGSPNNADDAKIVMNTSGRKLESIKSEEEKSNDDSHNSGGALMKKSDSFNIFKHRNDDPFADDDFFA